MSSKFKIFFFLKNIWRLSLFKIQSVYVLIMVSELIRKCSLFVENNVQIIYSANIYNLLYERCPFRIQCIYVDI